MPKNRSSAFGLDGLLVGSVIRVYPSRLSRYVYLARWMDTHPVLAMSMRLY